MHRETLLFIIVENAWCCLCNTYVPEGTHHWQRWMSVRM